MNQLNKKNYIPSIIALVYSISYFLLMILPHNQYNILSEMTTLNDSVSESGEIVLNLFVILPAIFTIFVILFLVIVVVFCSLSMFMDNFFNFHFLNKFICVFFTSAFLCDALYFFIGFNGVFDNGDKLISWGNYISFISFLICLIFYIYHYIQDVEKPFKEIKRQVMELEKKNKTPIYKEENAEVKEEKKNDISKDMRKMILDMLEKGKISSEEAEKLLEEIQANN